MIFSILIFIPILLGTFIYLLRNTKFIKFSITSLFLEAGIIAIIFYDFSNQGNVDYLIGGWNDVISITIHVDIYTLMFLFLVNFIWFITILYSFYKWEEDYKFYFFLNFLRGAFYALVLSNELFNIFVLIEIISIISAILITYKKDGLSVRAGIFYLLFNSTGMLFYLMGLVVLYLKIGSLNLSHLSDLPFDPTIKFAVSLIIVALGVKSAFFPVNNWLPRAHAAAPSSISAILSGLLVKAGFIVLFKFERFLDLSSFSNFLIWIGVITAITGFIFAISQDDIKSLLAFSTISQSGLILIGLSGSGILFVGGFLHLINHALYKTLLFLAVGLIVNKYHIRKIKDIKGVFQKLPVLSTLIFIGILSITGFPYTNGYVSKYLIKQGIKSNVYLEMLLHIINIGTITIFVKFLSIFKGETKNEKINEKFKQNFSISILGVLILIMGIIQMYFLKTYLDFNVSITAIDFVTYLIYLTIGYGIFKLFIQKEAKILYKLRKYELNFRDANILLVVFALSVIIFMI